MDFATGNMLGACLIVLATVAAYSNSFRGPFVFDDKASVEGNFTIRNLWPIWKALWPPSTGEAVQRRPIVNFSLAINYAISGKNVGATCIQSDSTYLAALLLFGIVRRTLLLSPLRDRWGHAAMGMALAVACSGRCIHY